ncbi:MAG TPA: peptidylprolyl isomerase [Cyclobacteriaceae bacterium]|nr:peptidylprolyl isomerase [Cyclobacteriaceae bacterium]
MKLLIAAAFVLLLFDVKTDLQNIKTEQEAKAYLAKSGLKGKILDLDEIRDSSAVALKLFKAKPGEIIETSSSGTTYYYKTLTTKESEVDRVQYIFFDNSKVAKKRIDSLRSGIVKKLDGGENFAALARQYSMDPNGKKGGDLGWYDRSGFVPGFVSAVRAHKKGDIFTVDLPKEKWYYVVRKSHDPIKRKQIKAFYVSVPTK